MRPPAAFLLNKAITRPASGHKTFGQTCPSYMHSFIKIGVLVLEKNVNNTITLCNFNKDKSDLLMIHSNSHVVDHQNPESTTVHFNGYIEKFLDLVKNNLLLYFLKK